MQLVKAMKSSWDFGYRGEMHQLDTESAVFVYHLYDDDGDWWVRFMMHTNAATQTVVVKDLYGFNYHSFMGEGEYTGLDEIDPDVRREMMSCVLQICGNGWSEEIEIEIETGGCTKKDYPHKWCLNDVSNHCTSSMNVDDISRVWFQFVPVCPNP